jgi:hypothetical protein
MGGLVIRRWTSIAPTSRSTCTSCRVVVPRTIESSTTISRFPRIVSGSGFSFMRTPRWRRAVVGSMNVRPM